MRTLRASRGRCAAVLTAAALIAAALAVPASAAFTRDSAGSSGANFLKVGVGARAEALGGAYGAAADDPSALYWNAAGLAAMEHPEGTAMYAAHPGDIRYQHLAFALPLSGYGGVAAFEIVNMTLGTINETDAAGTELGSFAPRNLAVAAGYARRLGPLRAGGALRFVSSTILKSASTLAVDGGLQVPFGARWTLGASIHHLGPGLKFEAERDPLPTTLRLGSAYAPSPATLLSADIEMPRDNDPHLRVGAERRLFAEGETAFMGRAGYNSMGTSIEGFSGPSFGFGLRYRQLGLDYAFAPLGELGFTHRLGVSWAFSPFAADRDLTRERKSRPERPARKRKDPLPSEKAPGKIRWTTPDFE